MEKKGQSLGGRKYLAGKLREGGLSRRQAARILNAVLAEMSGALQKDEEVEFPLGKLQRVKRHFGRRWELIGGWPAEPMAISGACARGVLCEAGRGEPRHRSRRADKRANQLLVVDAGMEIIGFRNNFLYLGVSLSASGGTDVLKRSRLDREVCHLPRSRLQNAHFYAKAK